MKFFGKAISIFLMLGVFVGCTGGCLATVPVRQENYIASDAHVNHMLNSTVQLMQLDEETHRWRSFCSGFFVSPSRVATAAHCVRERREIELAPGLILEMEGPPVVGSPFHFRTYAQYRGFTSNNTTPSLMRVAAFDSDEDVAVLELDRTVNQSNNWFEINSLHVAVGEPVYVVGNPGDLSFMLTNGIVSQLERGEDGRLERIGSTAPIFFGNSGGPLCDNNGAVIGVAVQIAFRQPVYGFHSPISNVVRLLNRLNRHSHT